MSDNLGSAILGGAGIVGGAINAVTQGRQNRKARMFAREMYGMQRRDALADWQMENEYNSPRAQMQRLQEAGLNPNLVYGHGEVGNSTGGVRAASTSTPDIKPTRPGDALIAGGQGFMSGMYMVEMKKAQVDLLRSQNTLTAQNALLAAAKTIGATKDNDLKKLSFDNLFELREQTRNYLGQNWMTQNFLQKQAGETFRQNLNISQENLNKQMHAFRESYNPQILAKTVEEIANIAARSKQLNMSTAESAQRIQNLIRSGQLQKLDIQMKSNGISWGDPMWQRVMLRALNGEGIIGRLGN